MLMKNLKTLLLFFTNWLLILKKEVISYAKDQRVGQTKVLDSSTPYLSVIHADNLAPAITMKKVSWETFRQWHYLGFKSVNIQVVMSISQCQYT